MDKGHHIHHEADAREVPGEEERAMDGLCGSGVGSWQSAEGDGLMGSKEGWWGGMAYTSDTCTLE